MTYFYSPRYDRNIIHFNFSYSNNNERNFTVKFARIFTCACIYIYTYSRAIHIITAWVSRCGNKRPDHRTSNADRTKNALIASRKLTVVAGQTYAG